MKHDVEDPGGIGWSVMNQLRLPDQIKLTLVADHPRVDHDAVPVVGRLGIDIVELGELLGKELAHLIGPGLEEGLLLELPSREVPFGMC